MVVVDDGMMAHHRVSYTDVVSSMNYTFLISFVVAGAFICDFYFRFLLLPFLVYVIERLWHKFIYSLVSKQPPLKLLKPSFIT